MKTFPGALVRIAAMLILLAANSSWHTARASVIYSNFGPGDSFSEAAFVVNGDGAFNTFPVDFDVASRFRAGVDAILDSIDITLANIGGANVARLHLFAGRSSGPDQILETILLQDLPTGPVLSPPLTTAASVEHPLLLAGEFYWLAVDAAGDTAVRWNNNDRGIKGFAVRYDGGPWQTATDPQPENGAFRMNGTITGVPIPEAATFPAAALGLVLLFLGGSAVRRTFKGPTRSIGLLLSIALAAWPQSAREANRDYETPESRAKIVERLESPGRLANLRPAELVSRLEIRPGSTVVDLGTGTGTLLKDLSLAVGSGGRVIAEDIHQDFLERARERAGALGIRNVNFVLGTEVDPKLPAGGADLVIVLDAYHHFDYPERMLAAIRRGLRPGGRLAIVEYHKKRGAMEVAPDFALTHIRAGSGQVVREVKAAGYTLLWRRDHAPERQYIAMFQRP